METIAGMVEPGKAAIAGSGMFKLPLGNSGKFFILGNDSVYGNHDCHAGRGLLFFSEQPRPTMAVLCSASLLGGRKAHSPYSKETAMSRQSAGQYWKWALSAGLAIGLAGLWSPCAWADEEKDEAKEKPVKKEVREEGERKDVKKEGDREEGKKEGDRKEEVKKDGDRKEGDRKDEGKKDAVKKDGDRKDDVKKDGERKDEAFVKKGQQDDRIDELAQMVKQLAGQVNELRQEIRSSRGGFAVNPEEMRKRMEEMTKKFVDAGSGSDKARAEMEKRYRAEMEKFRFRDKEVAGGDAEAQIRREIERLNAELKRIGELKEREGSDKKKEGKEDKEGAEAKERAVKERAAKEGEAKEGEAKERAAKERDAKERDAKEGSDKDKKPESK